MLLMFNEMFVSLEIQFHMHILLLRNYLKYSCIRFHLKPVSFATFEKTRSTVKVV